MTRKIRSGSRKDTGFFPSLKNERPVAFESLLEQDVCFLYEYDKDVLKYKEQPFTINYFSTKKRQSRYTPDLLVFRQSKTQVIEVKPEKELQKILNDEIQMYKYKVAARYCQSNGYEFKFMSDEIRAGNLLKNIKFLFTYSRLEIPRTIRIKIREQLLISPKQDISELLSEICSSKNEENKYYVYILALLYHQEIDADLSKPINKSSLVRL